PVVLCVISNEPDRTVHILDDLGNGEPGLAAVDDRERGKSAVRQRPDERCVDCVVRRAKAAADDDDYANVLGLLLGREDIHRKRGPELAAVDHVLRALERWFVGADCCMIDRKGNRQANDQSERGSYHVSDSVPGDLTCPERYGIALKAIGERRMLEEIS